MVAKSDRISIALRSHQWGGMSVVSSMLVGASRPLVVHRRRHLTGGAP